MTHGLVLAGHEAWGGDAVRRRIAELGLGGAVVLTGFVPSADLPALYNMADLFVFPSLREGFGLPPLEAMACGTPVVASNDAAVAETAGDAGVLVDPEDEAAIARAIRDVLASPSLQDKLRAAGRARASAFSWARTAEATERFYAEVLGRQGGKDCEAGGRAPANGTAPLPGRP